nr:aminoglycoside/hydroxyurea antibiotic resistance kinase [Couchioplanes caeruleus]
MRLAGGDPYARLIRHDGPRRALLLERLGRPMADLGWSAGRQLEALTRTAARGWRKVTADGRLPTGAQAARWHAGYIPAAWEALGRPCPEATVELAVSCAAAREGAADASRAVLVHGDVHAFNALEARGGAQPGFRLVDPEGLISEPAHDLGVIQARGAQGRIAGLAAGDPARVRERVDRGCRRAGLLTGNDPDAVRQWAVMELVSTGLFILRVGRREDAEAFLAVATRLT